MQIIPAIDIMYQRVVRLERGEFAKPKVYSENPVSVAKEWKDCGAGLLHVVDLEGARLGKPLCFDIVREIADKVGIDIELGGGLRSEEDLKGAFRAGARFAVIGTSAVTDDAFTKRMATQFKGKVIFALDVKDGKVAIKGWKELSGEDVLGYAKKLEGLGAEKIIYTDVSRDGMLVGPNLETLKSILGATSFDVIASGGVSTLDDIKALKALEKDGLAGVIIGKALYEGKIDLKEALGAG